MSAAANRPARLMMTAFGWNDAGGGTTVPRLTAKELVRRGWEVTVFHAAVQPTDALIPNELREWEEDGVRLIGVHNRAHGLFDLGHPHREVDDPPITAAFAAALDRLQPDVVHFHNLHNLGAALIDQAAARGLPAYFTTHNYWLLCPRAYLLTGHSEICNGPGDGLRCATCVGSNDFAGHQFRLSAIRAKAEAGLARILAVSDAVRHALVGAGYAPETVDVVRQAMPHEAGIWEQVGRARAPGRVREILSVGFLGSAYPHKGPQLLVEAAQRTKAQLDVRIYGEVPDRFAEQLRRLDRRGVVTLRGQFKPNAIGSLLTEVDVAVLPSIWWDCAPLAAAECLAARLPLVVPRLGGLPEAVRDGIDGLVFDALDADDLAKQLDRLASEPGLLEHLQAGIAAPKPFERYVDELECYYRGEREISEPLEVPVPAVRWQGDHGLATSLSIINDEVTSRLPYPVQRANRSGANIDLPLPHPANVEVHQQWPPDFSRPAAGRLATIVPWEFGFIPRQWLESITAEVDELWVPSEYTRQMYLASGVDPDSVHVIPNGVDISAFRPADEPPAEMRPTRFLYVGGMTDRKGLDVLLRAWDAAFPDRKDVVLVIKTSRAGGAYQGPGDALRQRTDAERLPRVELIDDDIDRDSVAALYRTCDVFVLPYRGEGFAMPVLEAMASGLPVITTAGGPTDEFCPPEAGWRIRSRRRECPEELSNFDPVGTPWMLEPDQQHLVELLLQAAETGAENRSAMGRHGRAASERYSWDLIAQRYAQRIQRLASRPFRAAVKHSAPFPLTEDVRVRVLATPAWRGQDQLRELLCEWAAATAPGTSACLYLLADPATTGEPELIEEHVIAAAAAGGVDLSECSDINILFEAFRPDRDQRLHCAVEAYVPLHLGCAGHVRLAVACGSTVIQLGSGGLAALVTKACGGETRSF